MMVSMFAHLKHSPETNIPPENSPYQKEHNIPTIHFSEAILVLGRVNIHLSPLIEEGQFFKKNKKHELHHKKLKLNFLLPA